VIFMILDAEPEFRIRDFSCDDADFEFPPVKIESLDTFQPHTVGSDVEPPARFYDKHGSFILPTTLVNRTESNKPFDLCSDCPFINSAGYRDDLAVMNLQIPVSDGVDIIAATPAPPFNPAMIVASMAQCNCSRFSFLPSCRICGGSDVNLSIHSITDSLGEQSVALEQPRPSNEDPLSSGDMDADGALTLNYPADDEDDLSMLMAPYQQHMKYQVSSLRSSLPQSEDPGPRGQFTGVAFRSTNPGDLDWPKIPSQYTWFDPAYFL